jgi:hypothetical protein
VLSKVAAKNNNAEVVEAIERLIVVLKGEST